MRIALMLLLCTGIAVTANDHLTKAVEYMNSNKADSAIVVYTKYIALDTADSHGYALRANAYGLKMDFNSALDDWTTAINLKPDEKGYYVMRANIYKILGSYLNCIMDYDQAIMLDSANAGYYIERARIKEYIGDVPGACDDYKRAENLGWEMKQESINCE